MSITCGFYNSISGDRKYNATQISSIFEGIITDGIFGAIGDAFYPTAAGGNVVNIGTGKCWFNQTWMENDALLPVDCGEANNILNRIDVVVIKVDTSVDVRNTTIECIQGTPSSTPSRPKLTNTETVHYYPLCYVERPYGSTEITQGKITDVRFDETPIIQGALKTIDVEQLFAQWRAQLDEFVAREEADFDAETSKLTVDMKTTVDGFESWTEAQKGVIDDWFDDVKGQLGEDPAVNLQTQIINNEIKRKLTNGLDNGTKTFSDDGLIITTFGTDGTLVKTFSSDFSTCTTVLYNTQGGELGRLVKTFSSDGSTISSELTIF